MFSKPLVPIDQLRMIAGPGYAGLEGGLFNPGAALWAGQIFVMAKGQCRHWKDTKPENYMKGPIWLFRFNQAMELLGAMAIKHVRPARPQSDLVEFEDFRVFLHQDQLWVAYNACHKVTEKCGYDRCCPNLARLDTKQGSLDYLGDPVLDREIAAIEKNWVFFEHQESLYLIYSFSPYTVLKIDDEKKLAFKTVVSRNILIPSHVFKNRRVSLSTCPVDYDQDHFLMFVHFFEKDPFHYRRYFNYAVLIAKSTLCPVKISSVPVSDGCGSPGRLTGVLYLMSVVPLQEKLVLFFGVGDSHTAYAYLSKSDLNKTWIDLTMTH